MNDKNHIDPTAGQALSGEHQLLSGQAHDWLVRLTSGSATTADAQEYKRWCAQSEAHVAAMAEASKVWAVAQQAGKGIARAHQAVPVKRSFRQGRRAFIGGALAAGVVGWLVVRPPGDLWPALSEWSADYRTGTGEQRELLLGDRIQVALNTQTSANLLHLSDGVPNGLELSRGEIQVDLPADAEFVVRVGSAQVTANTAARYNVRIDGPQVCITCLSGTLELSHGTSVTALNAAQQLAYGDDATSEGVSGGSREGRVVAAPMADIGKLNAWRKGVLIFDNVPLASVIEEINRYRPGKLVLTNSALGQRRVQAQVLLNQLADVVGLIQASYGANVTTLPAGIVVLS